MTGTRWSFGSIRRLPSKRFQASYLGPDMARHVAPETFTAKIDAEGWLALERRLVEWDEWTSPEVRRAKQLHDDTQTLRAYAMTWLPERVAVRGLKPKTVSEYGRYLDRLIYPTLGELRLRDVTPATVRAWIGLLNAKTPRINEHAYALLKTIFATAVQDELLDRNPCRDRMRKPVRHIGEPASLDELALLVAALPVRLRLMIELAAWCALRFGEVAELAHDLDRYTSFEDVERGLVVAERATGAALTPDFVTSLIDAGVGYPVIPWLPDHQPFVERSDYSFGPLWPEKAALLAATDAELREITWWAVGEMVRCWGPDEPEVAATLQSRNLSPAAVMVARRAQAFSGPSKNQGTLASWQALHAATNPDPRAALIAVADQLKMPLSWQVATLASVRERLRALGPQEA